MGFRDDVIIAARNPGGKNMETKKHNPLRIPESLPGWWLTHPSEKY